ncbi:SAP domain-containing protein [Chloropicon primus]|nr:SAP domain-containing protein [Chloropicon primus]
MARALRRVAGGWRTAGPVGARPVPALAERVGAGRRPGRKARDWGVRASGVEEDGSDDWDEIDKLMRELEDEERKRSPGEEKFAPASSSDASDGQGEGKAREQKGEAEFQKLTVSELKERLRTLGLPVSGRKAVLIDRLLSASAPNQSLAMEQGGSGDANAFFSTWDDVQSTAGGNFGDGSGGFDEGSMGLGPLGKPLFGDAELVSAPVDPAMRSISTHFDLEKNAELESRDYVPAVPADSEDMLRGYSALPEGYSWRGGGEDVRVHKEKFPGHQVFALSSDVDFLVRSREESGDGRLFLDLADVYMYHKPTEMYSVPEMHGEFPQRNDDDGDGFDEYYAYPVASWFPGDALKNKEPSQEVVKIILVKVKNADIRHGRELAAEPEEDGQGEGDLVHGEGFELDIKSSFVLDGSNFCVQGMKSSKEQSEADYEMCRSGKNGVLTSTRWNAFSFPKPLVLQFNEGSAAEDGVQSFGLCVSEEKGLSLQRWEYMQDPTEVVEEALQLESSLSSSQESFIEKGSPFEFLGKVSGEDVEQEWKELGLDQQQGSPT